MSTARPTAQAEQSLSLSRFSNRALIALIIIALFAGALAYQPPISLTLDSPGLVLNGFYDLEGRNSGQPYRWTTDSAHIWLGGIGGQPYHVSLRMSSARPNNVALPTVRIYANDTLLDTIEVTRPIRDYDLQIPPAALGIGGDLDLRLDSDTFAPPNDLRSLGVTLYAMHLETAGQPPLALPAPIPLALGITSLAFAYLALGAFFRMGRLAPLLSIFLVLAFCIGLATARTLTVAALPYTVLLSILAYIGATAISRQSPAASRQ